MRSPWHALRVAACESATTSRGMRAPRGPVRIVAVAAAIGLLLVIVSLLPIGAARSLIPSALAHAELVRSEPAARQVLQAPPSRVRMWFSEDLNALTSRAVVVDPTNKEVDNHDSEVSHSNPREMDVEVPLLPAGTYVVAWRTQSADDGHVLAGSFYFRIARPDGTVPPLPRVLPTGHIPGAGGAGTGGGLDGPGWLQAVATWLALVFMTFWVGGVIWETWILSPVGEGDVDLAAAGRAAGERFRRMAPWVLGLIVLTDVGIVLALSAELAGDWSGLVSGPLLRAVVFGSQFGAYWWLRQIVAGAALALTVAGARGVAGAALWRAADAVPGRAPTREPSRAAEWGPWLLAALRRLPAALARGWRARTLAGRAQLVLGAALVLAFALSGHAAAVAPSEKAYALSVDLLHLLGTALWAGGLLYIAFVLIPALRTLPDRQRAAVLARGLPAFSAAAIITVLVLAATGSLNATIHLTSITQFLTTTYGITLAFKIELFLVMAAISAYHAFRLRPRLLRALDAAASRVQNVDEANAGEGLAERAVHNGNGHRGASTHPGIRARLALVASGDLSTGETLVEIAGLAARPLQATSKAARRLLSWEVGDDPPVPPDASGEADATAGANGEKRSAVAGARDDAPTDVVGADAAGNGTHYGVDAAMDDTGADDASGDDSGGDGTNAVADGAASGQHAGAEPEGSAVAAHGSGLDADAGLSVTAARLTVALEEWLRREALLGVAVLLCVALLAAFAGSLMPAGASTDAPAPLVYVSAPQSAGGLTVILKVVPATFGTNTFTVTVRDAAGHPVTGAGVLLTTQMLDMDMGVQTDQLQPMAATPGVYSGQSDLTMAGHWAITVKVLPAKSQRYQLFTYKLTASY